MAVTASIACDAATVLPQDHVQELFQEFFDQGVRSVAEKKSKTLANVNIIVLARTFCSCLLVPNNLILVKLDKKECGVRVIRLCKEDINLEDLHGISLSLRLALWKDAPSTVPSNASHGANGNI
jgi:hypothetical protein